MRINHLQKSIKLLTIDNNLNNYFYYNQFVNDIEYGQKPLWDVGIKKGKIIDDDDIIQIKNYLGVTHDYEPNNKTIGEACFIVSKRNEYHPVKKYIETEKWDGTKRLNEWMIKTFGCDDNIYVQEVSKCFFLAATNRVYNAGCKFDHMIILEGKQGIGKSTVVEEIAGGYYVDTNFENKDKDLVDSMKKALIVEISELGGMNRKDINWLKGFLTRKVDCVRLAYAAKTKEFPRKCIFVGTYNPSGNNNYLRDDTGNRRFWPVECNYCDIDYIKKNKMQLWAEALELYKQKETYHLVNPESIKILKTIHEDRETEGPTYFKIKDYLSERIFINEITMEDLIENCLKINISGKSPGELQGIWTIIGIIMKKLGWKKGNNENRRKYYRMKNEEVKEW